MDSNLNTILCIIEVIGIVIAVLAPIFFRNPRKTAATRPQWGAILTGILGANAGYMLSVGSFMLVMMFQSPEKIMDEWLVDVAWVSYLCMALPANLGVGSITGLRVNRYAKKKSLTDRAGTMLNLAVSTGLGALLAVPIYFIGMMGAAL